ncbi:regulatory protein, luxR family [Mycolicibacterium rutilum]|uniref:Regulatory protein, luxR family n=1 Tax=Mycolicibacterium rutilum TaxID=370526 RepID=A0A1H6ILL2_MYCRU|nr:regulatory protein, luxR family [Mycolicibacterium rutilum]
MLDRFLDAVTSGESRALVIRGDAGVGKTALLDYLATRATGCRVLRASGVQAEMELAFAALHQLCLPLLDQLDRLPDNQHTALSVALGVTSGPAPDRFLVGLAVLNLFSLAAEQRPLVCLIDDEHWLDRASAQVLAFVARRLGAESVGLVLAAREPSDAVDGLPVLVVSGLRAVDARALLNAVLSEPLDDRVRDQIVAETGGNPLALLEIPRSLPAGELAGGFGLPAAVGISADMEQRFGHRIEALPAAARRLLLLAAAEPTGDLGLLWRAAELIGLGRDAIAPVVEADLATFATRVRFRHPLVRSATYKSASVADRLEVHRVLAEATDADLDPDRQAWHLANATPGPDEAVAEELVRSADRAQARGGVGAAAAFLERAAGLTPDSAVRADRALTAAVAKIQAGAYDRALDLLAMAESEPLSEVQHARVDSARAQIAFATSHGSDAPPLFLAAAEQLKDHDVQLCRTTFLEAFLASMFAGRLAVNATVGEVAHAAAGAPADSASPPGLLLDWLVTHYTRGYVAAAPALGPVLGAFVDAPAEHLRWALLASTAAHFAWDDNCLEVMTRRHVELARHTGTLSELPIALSSRAYPLLFFGNLAEAAAVVDELQAAQDATGSRLAPYAALGVAALRGDRERTSALIDATVTEVSGRGEGNGLTVAWWAEAVLHNGIGDYHRAFAAASRAAAFPGELTAMHWSLPELVEAAVRVGEDEVAVRAAEELATMAAASGTPWALGVGCRVRALVAEDADDAERLYLEAIEHFERTRIRTELARTHLLYGEWLRRERRRSDARAHLRVAHDMLGSMGMAAFAERARRELKAVGDTAQKIDAATGAEQLTAQEAQVARLARDGLSNPEIGSRLFISARTVQYHLSKVFTKLGISSRAQLERVLPD